MVVGKSWPVVPLLELVPRGSVAPGQPVTVTVTPASQGNNIDDVGYVSQMLPYQPPSSYSGDKRPSKCSSTACIAINYRSYHQPLGDCTVLITDSRYSRLCGS